LGEKPQIKFIQGGKIRNIDTVNTDLQNVYFCISDTHY